MVRKIFHKGENILLLIIRLMLVETLDDFILGGSKITADGDCSHEIKKKKNAYSLEERLWPT